MQITANELADPLWRIRHLYRIVNDAGEDLPFVPNEEQERLLASLWYRNIILKARQLGFTTLIDLLALDQCLWVPNTSAVIIAHNLDDAGKIFRTKVKFPYENLPAPLKGKFPLANETTSGLVFANGSSISVDTSARSGTVQFLHVSEMGKIAKKYPEKAREIVTGALPAVPKHGIVFVESTAEGDAGWFHDTVMDRLDWKAQPKDHRDKETELDFRLHFFPWFKKPTNVLDPDGVLVTEEQRQYFHELETKHHIATTPGQRAWYVKTAKAMNDADDMRREHPSTPQEAFAVSLDGLIFGHLMTQLRAHGRIGHVPPLPELGCYSSWDFGTGAGCFITLWQRRGSMNRAIKCFRGNITMSLADHWKRINDWVVERKLKWSRHYLPHDAAVHIQGHEIKTRADILHECGMRNYTIVPRTPDVNVAIDQVKPVLVDCEFDEVECADLVECLTKYSREWDEDAGIWTRQPNGNRWSHGADSFRTFGQGFVPPRLEPAGPRTMEEVPLVGGTY